MCTRYEVKRKEKIIYNNQLNALLRCNIILITRDRSAVIEWRARRYDIRPKVFKKLKVLKKLNNSG